MVIAIVILSLTAAITATFALLLKKDIKQLNRMLDLIRETDSNARLTTETFDYDISELCNKVNIILDHRREIVIKSERSNIQFKRAITNISHDLRTPLTSSIGYLQILSNKDIPPGKRVEYLDIIKKRLVSLTVLMNSLFEYTQIIEGRIEYKMERVNLCNVLRNVISAFYDDFMAKRFEVVVNISDTPIYVTCDLTALERVAQNLIRNAIEHGYERFELVVHKDSGVTFCNRVKSIEELDVEQIFERFYTTDFSRTSGNVGLGLAIAKELTEAMGGEIRAWKEGDMLNVQVLFKRHCE